MTFPAGQLPASPADHGEVADHIRGVQDKVGYTTSYPMPMHKVSGQWSGFPEAHANTTPALNELQLRRIDAPPGFTITQLAVYVITAFAGSTYRIGIYNDDGTGTLPDTLLLDTTTELDTTTGGLKACAAFGALDVGGIKWWGGVVHGAGGAVFQGVTGASRGMAFSSMTGNNTQSGYALGGMSGALTTPFGTTRTYATGCPILRYK